MRFFLLPYNTYSRSSRELAKALGIKRIALNNSRFIPSKNKAVINWGNTRPIPQVNGCSIINSFQAVSNCADKLKFFKLMQSSVNPPRIPMWTESIEEATKWLSSGITVCARALLKGHSGDGLTIFSKSELDSFVHAPLYTQYIKKREEYRVHFAFGKMIDIQRKILRKEDDNGNPVDPSLVNWQVRNLANGFIFARNDIDPPHDVYTQSELAYKASGLDFGAVDVIYNEHEDKAYVLEINCAPGLQGTTIERYQQAFQQELS